MKLVINKEIEKYASNICIGKVWIDTINDVLEVWNKEPFVQPSSWESLRKTMYLNEVQLRIDSNFNVPSWFVQYTKVINENMSSICIKSRKARDSFCGDDLNYLQLFWDRLNCENEVHARLSNLEMN